MYQTLAAIDIGSNTVHLIVAVTDGTQLTVLADDSIFVRLADGVWNLGYIPDERLLATAQAIYHLRGIARGFGAARVVVVATEVARTARNTSALLGAVQSVTGLEPLVLSGMDEAMLTFQGVTHGRRLPGSVAVADLGGGSLEIILAELGYSAWRTSLPLGSAFMHDRFVTSDPPRVEEIQALREYLAEKLTAVPNLERVESLITCGGTVNALMRLAQQIENRATGDLVLRHEDLRAALGVMLAQPYEINAAEFHLRVERAHLLPAGAVILEALLEHLRLPGMLVSQAGIREGIILAVARHGDHWLEGARADSSRPFATARAGQPSFDEDGAQGDGADPEADPPLEESATSPAADLPALAQTPLGEIAYARIRDLATKMVRYRKQALDGDVDAIHDMRVATRRLRTALETFAPCFPALPYRQFLRLVKRMSRALGQVRDSDVALADLRNRLREAPPELVPGLRALVTRHVVARREGRNALRRRLRANRLERIMRYVEALRLDENQIVSPLSIRNTQGYPPEEGVLR